MDGIKRLVVFGIGGAIGTAIGAAVASLMAPQTGKELQATTHGFVDEVKSAGDQAQAETEAALRNRFRQATGTRGTLTDVTGISAGSTPAQLPASR
ncbi:MAG: YtxH domain-containing protein [Thermomicrobiales bacterium]